MSTDTPATEKGQDQATRSGHFILSTYAPPPLTLVKGKGSWVWDDRGESYLDFTGGIAVNILGHAPSVVQQALAEQSAQLVHCSNLFYNLPASELAKTLVDRIGPGKIFFCNSGAEANETLFKLARKFGHPSGRYEIITTTNSFHGRTLAGISATGQEKVKLGFEPLVPGFKHVPFNDIEAVIAAATEKTVAVHIEGIQGEGGIIPADPNYLLQLRKWTKDHDILLLWDGVQCGHYRTGYFQSYECLFKDRAGEVPFLPDAVAMAKSMGAGVPIGASWIAQPHIDVLGPGSHGCTFGGNPLSASVALAVIREIEEKQYHLSIRTTGEQIKERLAAMIGSSRITDVRGYGALLGMTIEGDLAEARTKLMKEGLLLVPAANNTLRLLPPINVTTDEANEALSIIEKCL
jgi:acetylornithine/N-succinyldiaminopimelate aminotransferase